MLCAGVLLCLVAACLSSPDENGDLFDPHLIEGDIMLTDEQLAVGARASLTGRLWANNIMHYTIDASLANETWAMIRINSAIAEWEQKTCIRFRKRTTETAFVTFFKGEGCWSYAGQTGRQQKLSLAPGCWHHGIVLHEIGHALGFLHEQSRPDRDDYVTIKFENIKSGREGNFRKSSSVNSLGTSYDYRSIMHYGAYAFTKNGQKTIVPKQNVQIGQRGQLSDTDALQMRLLYKCTGYTPAPSPPPDALTAILTADDFARVFVDGKLVTSPSNNGVWDHPQQYTFNKDAQAIAVEIKNAGGRGGLVASFSNGKVTDKSWRCSSSLPSGDWVQQSYDDSKIPTAVEYGGHGVSGIASGAKWIGPSNRNAPMMYCRVTLRKAPPPPPPPHTPVPPTRPPPSTPAPPTPPPPSTPAPTPPPPPTPVPPTNVLTAVLTADDFSRVFVDGKLVTSPSNNGV